MNIKALLVAIVALFIYLQVKKHTSDERTLQSTLESYKESMIEGDYSKITELIYPKVFDTVSKEQVLQKLKSRKSSQTITHLQLTPRLPIIRYSEGVYVMVDYEEHKRIDMRMALKKDGSSLSEEELVKLKRITLAFLRMDKKREDEVYAEKESFVINTKKSGTYIFLNEHDKGWRYINTAFLRKKRLKKILHTDIINLEQEFLIRVQDSSMLELFSAK